MTTKETTPASDIKPAVLDMSKQIKVEIALDKATGVATVPADLYERLLPDGLTVGAIKIQQEHNSVFAAATLHALGQVAVPALHKNKDIDSVDLSVPTVGKDTFNASVQRSRQVPNRTPDGVSGTTTKFGSSSIEFNMYGTKSRGQIAKVKDALSAEATKILGG